MMGYKQKDVAFLLNIANSNRIAEWERGTVLPSTENLLKLSVIYRTLINEFYFDVIQDYRRDIAIKEAKLLKRA